jgi:nucleotidyltransferase substrate binding protein (TIGR01987 family)
MFWDIGIFVVRCDNILSMEVNVEALKKAERALGEALETYDGRLKTAGQAEINLMQAGVVQHFEFVYELARKMIERWLRVNIGDAVVDGVTRREIYDEAEKQKLIGSAVLWVDFHSARNYASHNYDKVITPPTVDLARQLYMEVGKLIERLR